jgi:hypothetical protein
MRVCSLKASVCMQPQGFCVYVGLRPLCVCSLKASVCMQAGDAGGKVCDAGGKVVVLRESPRVGVFMSLGNAGGGGGLSPSEGGAESGHGLRAPPATSTSFLSISPFARGGC